MTIDELAAALGKTLEEAMTELAERQLADTRSPEEWRTWLKVADNTWRLAVPGGWLYRYSESIGFAGAVALTFVPWSHRGRNL